MLVFVLHALYSKCLLLFYFLPNYEAFASTGKKIVLISQKRQNIKENSSLLVCFGKGTFSTVISNCSIEQRNVTKLDRYIINSHSVSGSKCSFTSVIYKYNNMYHPTFFSPYNMFSVYLLRVHNTVKQEAGGSHHARSGESSHSLSD